MKTRFLNHELTYDGTQLASHFAHRQEGILGDSCLGFLGPCDVALGRMVDLEDVRREAPIFSPHMLHFLLETFSLDLKAGVLLQRLLIVKIREELEAQGVSSLIRKGDDLYLEDKKLSVSIATRSPVSTLIHIGLNVETQGTPVPTLGLKELNIDAKPFGEDCLKKFAKEYQDILQATQKVRAVG